MSLFVVSMIGTYTIISRIRKSFVITNYYKRRIRASGLDPSSSLPRCPLRNRQAMAPIIKKFRAFDFIQMLFIPRAAASGHVLCCGEGAGA